MQINDLKPARGSFHPPKRVGRGIGSGHGKTACRGHKGQKARSGGQIHPRFEGGQMPLVRRIPKRGFRRVPSEKWEIVNLQAFNVFADGAQVDKKVLKEAGIIKDETAKLKVLAKGVLEKKLIVRADAFSEKAKLMIEEKGGKAEVA
ncbi:MAG: 50S ribosomal protein L15 [Candidatus Atribacteria bacterium]|nr:50S ribosomal protein L15 [Candidatus Atribacteria bacterium]